MSHDERIALANLISEVLSGKIRVGALISWLRWLVLSVVAGTVAVVGFVWEVRSAVSAVKRDTDGHAADIREIKTDQRETDKLVQRHDAILRNF